MTKKELKETLKKKQDQNFEDNYKPKAGFQSINNYIKYHTNKDMLDLLTDIVDAIPDTCGCQSKKSHKNK